MAKILFIGETWIKHIIHQKGFDTFTSTHYEVGSIKLFNHFREEHELFHIPAHQVEELFPDQLEDFDVVILSDVGSNTLLLSDGVFMHGMKEKNKCEMIRDFVLKGGNLLMIGGYMSFSGIDAKARYGKTEIDEVLPVKCLDIDDRVEKPQGIKPEVIDRNHEILKNIDNNWPEFFGYNKTLLKENCEQIMKINGDPFVVTAKFGEGRTVVFTSDCAPHWGPDAFVNWDSYGTFWNNIIKYLIDKA